MCESGGDSGSGSPRSFVVHVLDAHKLPLELSATVRLTWKYITQHGTSQTVFVNQDLAAPFNYRIPLRLPRTAENGETSQSLRISLQSGAAWRTLDELALALVPEDPASGRLSVTSGKGIVFTLELESKLSVKRLATPSIHPPNSRTNKAILDLEQRLRDVTKQLRLTQRKCATLRSQNLGGSSPDFQRSRSDVRRQRSPGLSRNDVSAAPGSTTSRSSLSPRKSWQKPVSVPVLSSPTSAEGPSWSRSSLSPRQSWQKPVSVPVLSSPTSAKGPSLLTVRGQPGVP